MDLLFLYAVVAIVFGGLIGILLVASLKIEFTQISEGYKELLILISLVGVGVYMFKPVVLNEPSLALGLLLLWLLIVSLVSFFHVIDRIKEDKVKN